MHNAICRPRTAFNDGRLRDIELTALVDDDVDRQLQLGDDRRRTRAQLEDDLETDQSAERKNEPSSITALQKCYFDFGDF